MNMLGFASDQSITKRNKCRYIWTDLEHVWHCMGPVFNMFGHVWKMSGHALNMCPPVWNMNEPWMDRNTSRYACNTFGHVQMSLTIYQTCLHMSGSCLEHVWNMWLGHVKTCMVHVWTCKEYVKSFPNISGTYMDLFCAYQVHVW